jgi:hypothetical protein
MNNKKRYIAVAILVVGIASLVFWITKKGGTEPVPSGDVSYADVVIPAAEPNAPVPDLNRPITFNDGDTDAVHAFVKAKMQTLIADIKKGNTSFENWNTLAQFRKTNGDYEGAKQIWIYLGKITPTNRLSFSNLGFLYGYILHDPVLGEKNFLISLKNDPYAYETYAMIFEFYRDVLKNPAKARDIAAKAKIQFPDKISDINKLLATL